MSTISARSVLEEVVARYAALDSYADHGVVQRRRLNEAGPEYTIPFATLFKRPARLRFEFARPHPYPPLRHVLTHRVVGFDGVRAYVSIRRDTAPAQIDIKPDVSLAVASATGVSGGAAHFVSRLLLPEVGGVSLLDLTDVRLNSDTVVAGVACHCIAAHYPTGAALELWIEQESRLVRRIQHRGDGHCALQRRDGIRVNEPLGDEPFAIGSPGTTH